MATYNGELFIESQVKSILDQTEKNLQLYIQDDGSTDRTCEIIKHLQKNDNRIKLFYNTTANHGPYQNFNILINECKKIEPFDYYLFADQDDIWDCHKLEVFTNFYKQVISDESIPTLIYGNMCIIDENDKITCPNMNEIDSFCKHRMGIWFAPTVWGCNMFMNRALFMDIAKVPDLSKRVWGHDQYFARWASIRGELFYMDKIVFQYRRHQYNVSNSVQKTNRNRIFERIKKVNQLAFDHAVAYKSALFVLEQLESISLKEKEKKEMRELRNVLLRGNIVALLFWIKYKIFLGNTVRTISKLIVLITGLYKKYLDEIE